MVQPDGKASIENVTLLPLPLFLAQSGSEWRCGAIMLDHNQGCRSRNLKLKSMLVPNSFLPVHCISPSMSAGEICAFNIHGLDAPFEAVVLNGTSGEGQLRARGLVDCELQKEYTFIIQAHDCGSGPRGTEGKKSHKAVVHIQVDDVNEFAPVFREPQYHAAVTEGKIYDSILQVEATDQDCSPQYSQICNYQITTTNSPFAIDRNGNIRNTEKLSYDSQQHYEILVTAWDCGQKRALHPVPVHIDVKPVCKPGWQERPVSDLRKMESMRGLSVHYTCVPQTDLPIFRPQTICDKEWHYYVINVEFPAVTLFVDGVTYDPYLVTDDWPIHPSQIDVQLTVGACWQGDHYAGRTQGPRFTQYFRGSLSGLTVRPGKIESQKVISCLQACKEGLDINSLESLDKSIKFHFNPAQSILVMEAEDLQNMNTAVRKVAYINSRQFPTPGIRRLKVSTAVQCFGEDTCITIPDMDAVVMVLQPSEPRITISGAERLSRPAADFRASGGIFLFQDLHIISTVTRADTTAHRTGTHISTDEIIHNLDYCDVLVLGEELSPEHESLQLHRSSMLGKHLDATNSTSGVDSMSTYEQVIRQVRYYNWRPEQQTERRFRLTCSELNGRYTSNEFNLEVSVLHRSANMEHVNHMVAPPQYMQVVHHPSMISDSYPSVPSAATVIIVVCIAALVVVVVLGIYHIHVTHQQEVRLEDTAKEEDESWDDSALTITVNPMEVGESFWGGVTLRWRSEASNLF
uniref:Calsyntenin 2 n=1 Tax=Oryzias sinensis TaxID=183150 RepID=A0A8C7XA10_9TELE